MTYQMYWPSWWQLWPSYSHTWGCWYGHTYGSNVFCFGPLQVRWGSPGPSRHVAHHD